MSGVFDVFAKLQNTSVNSAILVNSQRTERHAEYYRLELGINNSSGPAYEQVVVTDGTNSPSGYIFLPPAQESFVYDGDGNLVSDGRWTYSWDSENRLIGMQTVSTVADAAKRKLVFRYDYKDRRIQKQVWNWSSGAWSLLSDTRYVYDGWNLLAELDSSNNRQRCFVWGLDLSGTSQGAGGVGGLLMVSDGNSTQTHHFTCFDGNGNIVALINAADGSVTARYEYGPFGEVICITGPSTGSMAKSNPFRFSTKYADDETDLVYYGNRYYSPSLGRWISRDPAEEGGSINLYSFISNCPITLFDLLGLLVFTPDRAGAAYTEYVGYMTADSWNTFCQIVGDTDQYKDYYRGNGVKQADGSQASTWYYNILEDDPNFSKISSLVIPHDQLQYYQAYSGPGKITLPELVGAVATPVLNVVAAGHDKLGDAISLAQNGEYLDAVIQANEGIKEFALSQLAGGAIAKGVKFSVSVGKSVINAGIDNAPNFIKGAVAVERASAAPMVSRGFKTFKSLKAFLGSAGEGNEWHHIVEQSKIDKFGAFAIHNTDNVIAIPKKLNTDLNTFYKSVRYDITGSQLSIREWLNTKTLQQNYDFGIWAISHLSE